MSNSSTLPSNLNQIFNIAHPIFQAPMAGMISTPKLVAAAANTGIMGTIAAGYLTYAQLEAEIKEVRALTEHNFCVNLFVNTSINYAEDELIAASDHIDLVCQNLGITQNQTYPIRDDLPDFEEKIQLLIDENIHAVSFTFGIPNQVILDKLKHAKIKIIGTATHLLEAILWEDKGADALVLQGLEAGGHRATFIGDPLQVMQPLNALIHQIKKEIPLLPIIAAGGLMNAKDIIAVTIIGADAVMLGTAFLCSPESGASYAYKLRLLEANELDLILTKAWSGKWARGLKNKATIELETGSSEVIAPFPIQNNLTQCIRQHGLKDNNADYLPLWAGTGFTRCESLSATELINNLLSELDLFK